MDDRWFRVIFTMMALTAMAFFWFLGYAVWRAMEYLLG